MILALLYRKLKAATPDNSLPKKKKKGHCINTLKSLLCCHNMRLNFQKTKSTLCVYQSEHGSITIAFVSGDNELTAYRTHCSSREQVIIALTFSTYEESQSSKTKLGD